MSAGMSVLFRCDGFSEIGLGHVYRCLALASEMHLAASCNIAFAVRKGSLGASIIRGKGYTVFEPDKSDEPFNQVQWLKGVVDNVSADVLILDIRDDLSKEDVQAIRDSGILVAAIDCPTEIRLAADLAFYPPVPQVNKLGWTGFTGQLYVGWEWAILSQEFAKSPFRQPKERPCILVTMGGSDPAGLTLKAIEALDLLNEDFDATVVLGPGFSHDEELESLLKKMKRQFDIRRNVSDMADLMSRSDLAIASFGITAYELAAVGVPSIHMCLTQDHIQSASAFVNAGIAVCAGIYSEVSASSLAQLLHGLLADEEKRSNMANRGQLHIDGLGASRIAQVIFANIPKRKVKQWQEHKGIVLDSASGFDIIECEQCGFKHAIPIPTQEELHAAYRHEYYSKEKPLYLERAQEDLDWWNAVYSNRYDIFEQHLSLNSHRILDVGSGPGFFLLHGKERGWQTLGIEPSKQAASHSRKLGLDIVEDFLTEQTASNLGTFDVIHMSEVLEHIPDPTTMLHIAYNLLNPGGLLCVVVPNDYNPFQEALRKSCGYQPWWVIPPYHINYFNFDSISRFMAANGFEIILNEATFPIDIFLLMGDNYVGNDTLGRSCHAKRKTMELNLAQVGMNDLQHKLYQAFASAGIGREAMVVGFKK